MSGFVDSTCGGCGLSWAGAEWRDHVCVRAGGGGGDAASVAVLSFEQTQSTDPDGEIRVAIEALIVAVHGKYPAAKAGFWFEMGWGRTMERFAFTWKVTPAAPVVGVAAPRGPWARFVAWLRGQT